MKLWITLLALFGIVGVWMYVDLTMELSDEEEVKAFIESRGAGPVPRSWRSEVGKGI